ncbi:MULTISPECIES: VOC family protein [Vibrio]|uniref:VOC family protein n=1 Tax=Vibrio TaxID=662 RepID=UPI00207547F2|nr:MULTISPECIES: VOC family protein [Vibrio]USD31389.1 VOC family protein [Vibrio sp. SCSIO 43186]USD44434.1 VOC family protein [Vibrio sp. SCSIO 43145]USD68512.1 VOC family protein [Vibrio sp. SCSIO 43139]USD96202.1 glyoxalase [Vibrio coralliilyticus]
MAALTKGIHHVGLTVSDLEASAQFFIEHLGWNEVKRNPDYPAIFVSDGNIMLTLWSSQVANPTPFDRKTNVGLHHLALLVESEGQLEQLREQFLKSGIEVEFGPELVKSGPAKHLMCYDPSGIRVELFWPGL